MVVTSVAYLAETPCVMMKTETSLPIAIRTKKQMHAPQTKIHTPISVWNVRAIRPDLLTSATNHKLLIDLLLPIVSAASLPDHPSLSLAYSSPILTDMAQHAGETAQQERKMLANAKRLTTKLRGDHTWMPCELLCSNRDEVMFNTERFYNGVASCRPSRKANGFGTQTLLNSKAKAENMSDSRKSSTSATELGSSSSVIKESNKEFVTEISFSRETAATSGEPSAGYATKEGPKGAATQIRHEEGDVEMTEDSHSQTVPNDSETVERMIEDEVVDIVGPEISSTAGLHQLNAAQQETGATSMEDEQANGVVGSHPIEGEISIDDDHGSISITEKSPRNHLPTPEADRPGNEGSEEGNDGHDASQPVPRRMRTRAQAQAASEPTASRNDSPESWVPPEIHPLFKTPELAIPDKNFGLPPDEAHDTRRLLTMYVQKQEEVCRGAEKLYNGLLHADWQRRMVLKWCKAEAHVGEMSDGEDWYDKEEWGLEEDLVKGHDDEDGDTNAIQGKKTRGRRA